MARLAGSNPNYTFVLRDENTGRYVKDVTISLPSSTTIIKRTLANPALVSWAYRFTRDVISGVVSVFADESGSIDSEVVDMLTDADWLEEFLKENRLRPNDIRDERGETGNKEHAVFERLAKASIEDPDAAYVLAEKTLASPSSPYEEAIASWWLAEEPDVLFSEQVLPCLEHGYCGTVDLVARRADKQIVVTDLKTRRAGLYDYVSDQFQVDSYITAYNLRYPNTKADGGSVLLVFDDGTWDEVEVVLPPGSFLRLKAVDDIIEGVRQTDPGFGR